MGFLARLFGKTEAPPKARYAFSGAQHTRFTADWLTAWMSGKKENRWELRPLRLRSRELVRNSPYAQRYVGLCDENILGPSGICLQMRAMMPNGEPDEETNAQIEAAWAEWGQLGHCTLDGRLSFRGMESANLEQVARDGESLVDIVEGAPNEYGFALQLLDPDRLSEDTNQASIQGGPEVVMGVEIDRYNRPLAFHVLNKHPMDNGGGNRNTDRISADRMLHLGLITRVGQVRFHPWLTPVLLQMKMLEEYEFSALVSERASAGQMAFIIPGDDSPGPDPELTAEEQEQEFEVQPGIVRRLQKGETIADFKPDHPANTFDPFVRAKLRSIAAGLHVSYASLTGDYTSATWSSGRLALVSERDRWRVLQRWYYTAFHQRVFAKWLPWAVLRKKVRLPGPVAEFVAAATWECRGWDYVDPQKEIDATRLEIEAGLNDPITAAAEKGRDYEDIQRKIERARKLNEKYGNTIVYGKPAPQAPAPKEEDVPT